MSASRPSGSLGYVSKTKVRYLRPASYFLRSTRPLPFAKSSSLGFARSSWVTLSGFFVPEQATVRRRARTAAPLAHPTRRDCIVFERNVLKSQPFKREPLPPRREAARSRRAGRSHRKSRYRQREFPLLHPPGGGRCPRRPLRPPRSARGPRPPRPPRA